MATKRYDSVRDVTASLPRQEESVRLQAGMMSRPKGRIDATGLSQVRTPVGLRVSQPRILKLVREETGVSRPNALVDVASAVIL